MVLTTWILVANRSGAKIFQCVRPSRGLTLVQEIEHPEGRMQNQEIDTDRPGRLFSSSRDSNTRHGVGHSQDATEHAAEQFAERLAAILDDERAIGQFDRLVLVCEPRFLGLLRKHLKKQTLESVAETVIKNLIDYNDRDIAAYLHDVVQRINQDVKSA